MLAEEYDAHICTPITRGYETIEVDYLAETKDAVGQQTWLVKGMDGILYTLVKKEKKESDKVPFLPSDASLQRRNPTDSGQNLLAGAVTFMGATRGVTGRVLELTHGLVSQVENADTSFHPHDVQNSSQPKPSLSSEIMQFSQH